ncbi:TPA: KAP family NTPase [Vibrio alginolyticus]|uniref:KAP family P-loop NTPase fold protein n=1 Tax=Vibrio diabolicus TaxID=50719 RepID=UPI002160EE86|nr:KAP family NTPase [Vibrio diabolicus]MCS0377853.1 KAP family NTPase [Vibrio diabolicus]MCS0423456.1 KAP family NTPase [Vibrio diabolicus]
MSTVVPKEETFENYELIDRKPFANYLTAFLNTKAEEGYVINLNAEWGAGKTTFLQCWYNELSKGHPTIYFDAWRSDFSKDAMLALIDCFHAQLTSPISENKELIESLLAKGSYFIRKSLPSLLVGYLKHKTGAPEDESIFETAESEFGIEIDEGEAGNALKDVLKEIVEQRQKVKGISDFQNVLVDLADAVIIANQQADNPKQYPVYVLIDELDRCRPSYAIEIIESVKHFFNTKHFVFVIATDTEQLQHSVKAVYGEGFNAHSYLSRFFHKTVTLPAPSTREYLVTRLTPIVQDDFEFDAPFLLDFLVGIFEWHNMNSLREIDKVIQDLEIAKSTEDKSFKVIPLLLLSVLKRLHPDRFNSYIHGSIVPYRHNNHNNSLESIYLPRNNSVKSIRINGNISVVFENAMHHALSLLGLGNSISGNIHMDNLGSVGSHNQASGIQAICSEYAINPSCEHVSKDGYIKVLNLAGHFE